MTSGQPTYGPPSVPGSASPGLEYGTPGIGGVNALGVHEWHCLITGLYPQQDGSLQRLDPLEAVRAGTVALPSLAGVYADAGVYTGEGVFPAAGVVSHGRSVDRPLVQRIGQESGLTNGGVRMPVRRGAVVHVDTPFFSEQGYGPSLDSDRLMSMSIATQTDVIPGNSGTMGIRSQGRRRPGSARSTGSAGSAGGKPAWKPM
jgi:hypothetical protein